MLYKEAQDADYTISAVGVCRFCKQQMTVEILQNWNEHEIDEVATELCGCNEAMLYAERKKRSERACTKIEELFGEGNKDVQVPAKTVNALRDFAFLISEKLAAAVSVDIGNGVKAKITKTPKGDIKVMRTKTDTKTYEC